LNSIENAFFLVQGPMLVDIESSDDEHAIEISGKVKIRASEEMSTGSPKPKDQKYVYLHLYYFLNI
jgi:hypothetical protein